MIKRLLNHRTNTLASAAILLGVSSFLSAVLGLLRDRLLTGNFGASRELDIYYAAFKMPDLVVSLLISGGVIASFLPVFSEEFLKDKNKAWNLTNNALNVFLLFSIALCFLLSIFAPWLINLIVPGFSLENKMITVHLTRIMFLSPIFFGVSNIFSSILQYFNRFIFYALAPILYNLSIIFGIVFLLPKFGLSGLAWGVVLGALLHCLIQFIPSFFCGFSLRPQLNIFSPEIKKIVALMIPRTISATASRLNIIVITAIASTLGAGSIAIFSLSDNLRSLPVGIIGGSFAIASYSFLTRSWVNGKKDEFFRNLSLAFRQTIFIILPISFMIFILRAPIVRIILGTGKFGWTDTRLTAASLGLFSIGILAYSLIPIIVRAFFSFQDTKTPLYTSLFSITANISLSLLFVWLFKFPNIFSNFFASVLKLKDIPQIAVISFPLSVSLAGYLHLFLLGFFLYKKIGDFRHKEILQSFKKIFLATLITSFFVYIALYIVAAFISALSVKGVLIQALFAGFVGVLVYIGAGKILKIEELNAILNRVGAFIKKIYPSQKNG